MKLRISNVKDISDIANIHAMSWRHTYDSVLTVGYLTDIAPRELKNIWEERLRNPKPNQYVVLAENDGKILGFACAFLDENPDWGTYLDNLHVRKSVQAQGIGKALLFDVANWCFQHEPKKGMCLTVNQDNIQAQEFYLKHGARNAKEDVWNAPDGSIVPTYWFVWNNLEAFVING